MVLINLVISMNLWRRAPWRGTYQCEAPFHLIQFESYLCGSLAAILLAESIHNRKEIIHSGHPTYIQHH